MAWQLKQQSSVALSTAEVEFVAAAVGVKELLGVCNLLEEVGVHVELPMSAYVDNQTALKQLADEAMSTAQKHVDGKVKFVRDAVERGIVNPTYVATEEMLANVLTKRA